MPAEIRRFRRRLDETGITPVVSHASYLINLATHVPLLRELSIAAFVDELDRAHALGLLGVVIHPGTCTAGTEDDALRLIAEAFAHGVQGAAAPQDDGAARAHGRPGPHARPSLRASRRHHRASRWLAARRRLPRHLPSRRVRLRHRERRRATPRRSRPSIASSASIACGCSTATTRSGRAAAASIGTSTSATAASASSRSAGCCTTAASRICRC